MAYTRLDHAKHNAALAEQLFKEGIYLDWVVTTAYYACNHYVKYHLFPLKDHGIGHLHQPLDNWNEYTYHKHPNDKHAALCDLFYEKTNNSTLRRDLKQLLNHCNGARYINYQVSPHTANDAIITMRAISKYCATKRVKKTRKRIPAKTGSIQRRKK